MNEIDSNLTTPIEGQPTQLPRRKSILGLTTLSELSKTKSNDNPENDDLDLNFTKISTTEDSEETSSALPPSHFMNASKSLETIQKTNQFSSIDSFKNQQSNNHIGENSTDSYDFENEAIIAFPKRSDILKSKLNQQLPLKRQNTDDLLTAPIPSLSNSTNKNSNQENSPLLFDQKSNLQQLISTISNQQQQENSSSNQENSSNEFNQKSSFNNENFSNLNVEQTSIFTNEKSNLNPESASTNFVSSPFSPISVFQSSQPATPRSPIDIFERTITNTLERSFNNFKRILVRDITQSFKQTDYCDQNSIDSFSQDLLSNIEKAVLDQDIFQIDSNILNTRCIQLLDDGTKVIKRQFIENEQKSKELKEEKLEELSKMNQSLSSLSSSVYELSKKAMEELNRVRIHTSNELEHIKSRKRSAERKLQSLKLRTTDYEGRIQQQKMETEAIQRSLKTTEESLLELTNPQNKNNNGNKNESISEKILKEIETIQNSLNASTIDDFIDLCQSLTQKINDISNNIQEDIEQLATIEGSIYSQIPQPIHQIPIITEFPKTPSQRIEENRKIIEKGKSIIEESIKSIKENEKLQQSMLED